MKTKIQYNKKGIGQDHHITYCCISSFYSHLICFHIDCVNDASLMIGLLAWNPSLNCCGGGGRQSSMLMTMSDFVVRRPSRAAIELNGHSSLVATLDE